MSRWFRAYDDALDDPKVQTLPDALFKAWFNLMCVTSKNAGQPFDVAEVAFRLRVTEAKAKTVLDDLTARKLLDVTDGKFVSHNWDKRQFKSDVSNERVKRHRKRHGNGDCNVTGNEYVAPPETEQNRTEAETEKPLAKASALKAKRKAIKTPLPDGWSLPDEWREHAKSKGLLDSGINREAEKFAAWVRREDARYINWLAAWQHWIAKAIEFDPKLVAAVAVTLPPSATDWDGAIDRFKKFGTWPRGMGGEPGMLSCRVPPEILSKHGYSQTTAH